MSRRRRFTVAFELLEEPEMRVFRHAQTGVSVDEILAEPRRGVPLGTLWCAACFTENAYDYRARRIYDGSEVPEDAECADCFVPIRDLQEMLRR